MRTIPLSLLAAACPITLALGLSATRATAGEPSARDLIALAPAIRSSDEKIRSIEIDSYERVDGKILRTYRALYRAPDQFAFIIRDGHDGTPVIIASGRKLLVYDPVKPEVLVFPHVANFRTIKVEGGELVDSWGANFSGNKPEKIEFDIRSMFTSPSKSGTPTPETVTKVGERRYLLSRKVDGVYRRSLVDLDREDPFVTFETAASAEGSPYRCYDRIIVNGKLNDSDFAFPSLDGLAGTLKVREVTDGLFDSSDALGVAMRTFYVRRALQEPGSHRKVITPLLMGIRWGRVEENDRHYAKLIRDLIPEDPIRRAIDPADKSDNPDQIERTGFDAIRHHLPHLPIKFRVEFKHDPPPPASGDDIKAP